MALRNLFTCMNVSMSEEETFRKAMPTHYLFKIQGFSQLSKNSIEKYESNEFEAEGHKWRLLLYPNGNKAENRGLGHISLYLVLVDTGSSLPDSGELNVILRLFLFDQIRERYLIRGDTEGRTSRFREMKVCGVPQFVSLAKFRDPSNGYLVNDTCIFGAEVFIIKPTRNIECLSMVTPETIVTHTWRIGQFSTKICSGFSSEKFIAGNHNWTQYISSGTGFGLGKMSLYLNLADCKENPGLKVNADFKLRLKNQNSGNHIEYSQAKQWFNASSPSWGWKQFIKDGQLGKAFLLNDTCIVEAEIKILEIQKEMHRKKSLSNIFTRSNISMVEEETFREVAPTHYLFKIQAFSQHSINSIEKYESNEFEVGGHKWKLSLYPNGSKAEYGGGGYMTYISLYLVLVDTDSSLPASGELNVIFRLFLFDQIRDRYLIRGASIELKTACTRVDTEGRTRRLNEMKMCGFPHFVSLEKFKNPSNGYLVDDTCLFGAEVFVTKPTRNIECLSMVTRETIVTYTWRIVNFSEKKEQSFVSEKFIAGNHNWNILIYPKGDGVGKNKSMSLFLNLEDCKENPGLKVYAECILCLKDQLHGTKYSAKHWFNASFPCWGIPNFIGLDQLNGKNMNDTCIVEAKVKILGVVTKNP